jgi:hypothetical protein
VPAGTAVKDGNEGLDELVTFVLNSFPQLTGWMTTDFTTASATTNSRYRIVNDNSSAGTAAGYRFAFSSQVPGLDPLQDPASYVPIDGFTNAIAHAVALKGKFIEIMSDDADSADAAYHVAMTDAQTALAANP